MRHTIILSDRGLTAQLFASRVGACTITRKTDEVDRTVVFVDLADDFCPVTDYVVRQVSKGRTESQLVAGSLPKWAGGELNAPRELVASSTDIVRDNPVLAQTWGGIMACVRAGIPVEVPNAD